MDFHNLGCYLLSTKNKTLFRIYKYLEIFLVKFLAEKVFTVSEKMKEFLKNDWKFKNEVTVLYDEILDPNIKVINPFILEICIGLYD